VGRVWSAGKFHSILLRVSQRAAFETKTCLGKEAKRGGRIVLRDRERGVEPEMVCRGNRPEGGTRVSAKNDAGQIVAIDGRGDGFAKLRGAEPGLFVFGKRRGGNLVKPHELRIEARACIVGYCRCF